MPDMQDPQMTLHGYERRLEGENLVAYTQYWVLLPLLLKEDVSEQKTQ
jgi:hypothetical protein